MRKFWSVVGIMMLTLTVLTVVPSTAKAFSHGSSPAEDLRWHAYDFVDGLAIHGEHPMWSAAMADVLTAAETFDDVPRVKETLAWIAERQKAYDEAGSLAFTDTSVSAHYNTVHPMHDQLANLARMMMAMASDSPEVILMAKNLMVLKDLYRDDALCNYVALGGAMTTPPGVNAIDYATDINADMWENIDAFSDVALPEHTPLWMLLVRMISSILMIGVCLQLMRVVLRWRAEDKLARV